MRGPGLNWEAVQRLLTPIDGLGVMRLPIFGKSLERLEERHGLFIFRSMRDGSIREGTDNLGVRLGAGQKKTGLRHLIGNIELFVANDALVRSFCAQLFVSGTVVRSDQERSHDRKTRVVSGPILEGESRIVGRLVAIDRVAL